MNATVASTFYQMSGSTNDTLFWKHSNSLVFDRNSILEFRLYSCVQSSQFNGTRSQPTSMYVLCHQTTNFVFVYRVERNWKIQTHHHPSTATHSHSRANGAILLFKAMTVSHIFIFAFFLRVRSLFTPLADSGLSVTHSCRSLFLR